MVAYGNLYWFYAVGLLTLPAVVLGLSGRRIRGYGLVATLLVAGVLMVQHPSQLIWLVVFCAYQGLLVKGWLRYLTSHPGVHRYLPRAVAVAATLPLALVKVLGIFPSLSVGFLGVSYLSFKVIQLVLEITDGLIKEPASGVGGGLSWLELAYFVLFFPTLASGPIDRSRRFQADADRTWTPTEYSHLLGRGLTLLLQGAVYKFVLAAWFASQLSWASGWPRTLAYMYLYSGQLFFDFAGYSAMAVGLSYLYGVRTPPNFRMPFVAESIKDFWNRWHISLSFWFRDYLYTRMTMYLMRRKLFKERATAGRVAMVANMVLMGFWHGFTVHYVLYGLYHGVLLVANDVYEKKCPLYAYRARTWYRIAAILVTAQLVIVGFLIFSGHVIAI